MVNNTDNGRVTMAILSAKLDMILQRLDEMRELQSRDHDRIGCLEGEVRRVQDRQNVWTAGQATLSVIVGAVAAWLGMRQ